ncbi:MAG TPA: PASTA domain-containing protein [bacterium]|nr:PASTA domain-containing protein [bacterium]
MADVVGLELEEARRRLAAAGLSVRSVTETRPPHPVELIGPLRVVRVRRDGAAVDLVVTHERYVPRRS